nr:NUDIX hydrolase [Pseudomonas aeruginosa]
MAQPLDGLHDADHPKAEKTEGRVPSVSDPRALAHLLELILSTAQAGLAFSKDRFDIGRFRALQHAVAEFIASDQGVAYERVENWIALDSHYPTPKLDVRALILDSQQRVLLVREASDGRWTLPGGWCDVNESPADAVVRETQEESGLEVRAIHLLALLDKHKHPHPPQLPHALKAFFFCHVTGGRLQQQTDETSAAEYFPVDALPPLSEHRVLASQIHTLWQRIRAGMPEALFD